MAALYARSVDMAAYRWREDCCWALPIVSAGFASHSRCGNGVDPILKKRLLGLTGLEGNHGEDVKEAYYCLDSTPTHSYLKALHKYPRADYLRRSQAAGNDTKDG